MTNNKKYDELFASFDKAKAFDRLAELFYDRNFSSASKSEIELLMFSFYLDATISANTDEQNVLDYVKSSDYEMAKQLGLTQEKVRNLKIRKQARYPVDYDWERSLKSIQDNIRVDDKGKIIIPVTDPNLSLEIKNFIQEHGGYIEYESGKDFIRMRVEYFLMLMYYTMSEEEQETFIKTIRKQFKKTNENEDAFAQTGKLNVNDVLSLVNGGFEMVNNVISIFTPTNPLAAILQGVLKRIKG